MMSSSWNALFAYFGLVLAFSDPSLAQTCWRNSTCSSITKTAFPGRWDKYIYAPSSRTVAPKSVLSLATGQNISSYPGTNLTLATNGSALVFDFGLEVGGIVTIKYTVAGTGKGAVGLAFTEAKNWIGEWSDSSNGAFRGPDGALYSNFSGPGANVTYTMPDAKIRGGFRYLTLFLLAPNASVQIADVSLEIGFQPTWSNLRAYQGYFYCNDDVLNKIWYAGAYTLQTNAVPPSTGRKAGPMSTSGWMNDGYLGPGNTIIVDGAKRDRAVWPGDMGVAVPSTFVSVGDLESVKNALQVIYDYQNTDGSFPEAGPPLLQQGSDTYHMWTMIGTYNYLLYTNDTAFLRKNWSSYLRAMTYIYAKVRSPLGLLNVTGTRDWARWQTFGLMSHAQMILYRTLTTGAELAVWASEAFLPSSSPSSSSSPNLTTLFLSRASMLQNATLTHCYSPSGNAFKDNTSSPIFPQDANSLSLAFSLIPPFSVLGKKISTSLLRNWTPIGPASPELPGQISPFISSFEILAHLQAGYSSRSLKLIRSSWGWYLSHPNGTGGSTVIEGYLVNGSFAYRHNRGYADTSYVSHAHGWSSGPTSALTEYVLGLRITERLGKKWLFAPQMGDLTQAEGGFWVNGTGGFKAAWVKYTNKPAKGDYGDGYRVELDTPEGTRGEIRLPVLKNGEMPEIKLDGKLLDEIVDLSWYYRRDNTGRVGDEEDLDLVDLVGGVEGGKHTIYVNAK
ncbi:Six-hairpin glycosidase-like protein [Apodospora peruviana]|uniref:Six-hairpin glycosidase-like protein n=1 Tax=Apodospora peruviana TaxID=516989 RepID=A0AAE0I006_9PEZI|nr:Six-hairpin glycosidase-like protein [Apodospora peruviana]